MDQRHHRLAYTGIAAAIALGVGLLALNFPVFLDDFDKWGWQIKCGTGYLSDFTQAAAAGDGKNYSDACGTAVLIRRLWAGSLAMMGASVLLVVLLSSALASARESLASPRRG